MWTIKELIGSRWSEMKFECSAASHGARANEEFLCLLGHVFTPHFLLASLTRQLHKKKPPFQNLRGWSASSLSLSLVFGIRRRIHTDRLEVGGLVLYSHWEMITAGSDPTVYRPANKLLNVDAGKTWNIKKQSFQNVTVIIYVFLCTVGLPVVWKLC